MAPGWAHWSIGDAAKKDGKVVREWNDKKFGTFVLPGNDGKPAPVFAGGSNIAISAKSKNPELSKELMKIIFSPEYQQKLGGAGLGPANSDYVSSLGDDEFAKALIDSASNSKLTPAAPGLGRGRGLDGPRGVLRQDRGLERPRRPGEGVRRQDHPDAQRQVMNLPGGRLAIPAPAAGEPPPPEDPAMTTGTTTAPTTPSTAAPQRRNRRRKNRLPLILIVPRSSCSSPPSATRSAGRSSRASSSTA